MRNNGSFHPAPGNILGPYSPRTIVQETFGGQHWAGQATDDGEEAQGNPDELIDFFGGLLQVLDLERLAFDLLRPRSPMSRLRQEVADPRGRTRPTRTTRPTPPPRRLGGAGGA